MAERLPLDTVIGSTNVTGATVANLDDDPDSPDANFAVANSNAVSTEVHVGFATPSGTLVDGADLQEFRIEVRQFDEGQTGVPTARIELWEGGTLVRAGSNTDVTGGSQVIAFTWDATEITVAADVECKMIGTKVGGAGGVRNAVDHGAVEWNADAGGPSSGTIAQTLPSISQSASATVSVIGTIAQTLLIITQAVTGGGGASSGTIAQTLQPVTQTASGAL